MSEAKLTNYFDASVRKVVVQPQSKIVQRPMSSVIPTTTGSATAIAPIYPELKGHAVRVPVLNASLMDCLFEPITTKEMNRFFKAAAEGPYKSTLDYKTRPLVSTDYTNDPRSAIVDTTSTTAVNGTHLKVCARYDKQWGY